MHHRHQSYVRPHRRRWGLTQQELAFLIGVKSRTAVSRIEGSKRRPSLDAVFICMLSSTCRRWSCFLGLCRICARRYAHVQTNSTNSSRAIRHM
ncbi:helix-turn-helix domain-containing protein [Bradyrhizobium stylosanthis]|uniref:helix-turn-helix transcriptional regulator n=1 Tax=Bradyrhizobium stylosanthis TaxID=1803665 RepID=UPI0009EDFB0B